MSRSCHTVTRSEAGRESTVCMGLDLEQIKTCKHSMGLESASSQETSSVSAGLEAMEAASANGAPASKRYDRQIRIWGAHGQHRLESCKVALLNCGPTGAEALKNLVLGGIAGFTIVDGARVSAADLGNNFMVDASSLGEPRAKIVTEFVKELNDSVAGSYVEETPEALLESNPAFFSQFTVVIATQMREPDLVRLDEICRQHKVILMVVRSYGLSGVLRASVPEHRVIESKPDNIVDDLRLHSPWHELQQLALSFDLKTLDDVTHRHTPYAILLLQAAQRWKEENGGKPPSNGKERSAFKELLRSMKRSSHEVPLEEENFDEAEKAAFHVWTPYTVPSEVRAVLEDEAASPSSMGPSTDKFWILVAALKQFLENEGQGQFLPLDGSIPDMHATTELYLRLQRVYREKAERDISEVEAHVQSLLARVGQDPSSIGRETVRHFCKNARNIRVIRYRSLSAEYSGETGASSTSSHAAGGGSGHHSNSGAGSVRGQALSQALGSEGTQAQAALYILLRAVDRFYTAHGRFPGTTMDQALEEDVPLLKSLAQQILVEMGAGNANIPEDWVLEVVRFGAGELHVVAAFMGGVAAQEVIKLVTGQFTTLAGTLVYNAVGGATSSFEL